MVMCNTALVIRAQRGLADAFEQLMAAHERPLMYYIGHQLGDMDRALDISQEVWITVWKSIRRLKDARSFRAWLYQIAHRQVLLEYRRERRHDWGRMNEYDDAVLTTCDAPVDMSLLIGDLHDAIDKLPERLREVIILRYIAELTVENVSLVVECPIGTVKSRLYHPRKELKRLIEGNRNHE